MKKIILPLAILACCGFAAPVSAGPAQPGPVVKVAHPACTAPMVWSDRFKRCVRPRSQTIG